MTLLSIIVPVYNVESFLPRCLESLINQTLKENFEIILINDGSTDCSYSIMKEYAKTNANIRIFDKKNGGQGSARNVGIRKSVGKYLAFVDSDDYVDASMFEAMLKLALKEKADLVTCDYSYLSLSGTTKDVHLFKAKCTQELFFNPWAAPWNKIYKASLIKTNNIYFPENLIYEDTAFYLNMIPYMKKIAHVEKCFVKQVQREVSSMNGQNEVKVMQILPVMHYSLRFYQQHNWIEKYGKEFEYFYVKLLFSSSVLRICQIRNSKVRKKCLLAMIKDVNEHFPNYKKNIYFKKGAKGFYIRMINSYTISILSEFIYFIRYFGRSNL